MAELGAGGGKGDLDQQHELEIGDAGTLGMLISLCATKLKDTPQVLGNVVEMLASLAKDDVQSITLDPSALHSDIPGVNQEDVADLENLPLERLVPALTAIAAKAKGHEDMNDSRPELARGNPRQTILPKRIVNPPPYPIGQNPSPIADRYLLLDFPLLAALVLHRALPLDHSLQAERHLAMHSGKAGLVVRVAIDELPLWSPLRVYYLRVYYEIHT